MNDSTELVFDDTDALWFRIRADLLNARIGYPPDLGDGPDPTQRTVRIGQPSPPSTAKPWATPSRIGRAGRSSEDEPAALDLPQQISGRWWSVVPHCTRR